MDSNKENKNVLRGRKRLKQERDLVESPGKKQIHNLGELCKLKMLQSTIKPGCNHNKPREVHLAEMRKVLLRTAGVEWEEWSVKNFQELVEYFGVAVVFRVNGERDLAVKHDAVKDELSRMMTMHPEVKALLDLLYIVIDTPGAISEAHDHVLRNWLPKAAVDLPIKYSSNVTPVPGSTRLWHVHSPNGPNQAKMDAHALLALLHNVDDSAALSLWEANFAPTSYP